MKIDVRGIKKTVAMLVVSKAVVNRGSEEGLKKAALHVQNEVKSSIAGHRAEPTSVDTGRFLNSVDLEAGKEEAVVFSEVPYSKHLELGTSRIAPRRHFENSKNRNKRKIKEIIQSSIV